VEQGGASELDGVGDDPAGKRLSEDQLAVEIPRQVVGGYAQVHEIGIDPVKLRQLPRDFAAALNMLSQALRQSA
jgi:hypothetical protein